MCRSKAVTQPPPFPAAQAFEREHARQPPSRAFWRAMGWPGAFPRGSLLDFRTGVHCPPNGVARPQWLGCQSLLCPTDPGGVESCSVCPGRDSCPGIQRRLFIYVVKGGRKGRLQSGSEGLARQGCPTLPHYQGFTPLRAMGMPRALLDDSCQSSLA